MQVYRNYEYCSWISTISAPREAKEIYAFGTWLAKKQGCTPHNARFDGGNNTVTVMEMRYTLVELPRSTYDLLTWSFGERERRLSGGINIRYLLLVRVQLISTTAPARRNNSRGKTGKRDGTWIRISGKRIMAELCKSRTWTSVRFFETSSSRGKFCGSNI